MAGTGQLGQNVIAQLKVIVERVGQILIQSLAVGGGDAGDIVERLGAALDLQAVHTCLADEVDEGSGAQIVCIEDIAAVLIFADLIQLARAGLLAQIILPAAGLGALAPVCIPACHVIGEQAPARNAHAHGSVDKRLDLQLRRGLIAQGGDILQAHLTGQHHTLCTHVVSGTRSGPVGDAGLGGHVDIDLRGELLTGFQHAQIGHDKGIHTGGSSSLDGFGQAVSFLIGGQRVHGQIDLAAAGMGIDHTLGQLLRRKIGRSRPHTELRQAAINSVCSIVDGITQALQVTCRGQQFRDL